MDDINKLISLSYKLREKMEEKEKQFQLIQYYENLVECVKQITEDYELEEDTLTKVNTILEQIEEARKKEKEHEKKISDNFEVNIYAPPSGFLKGKGKSTSTSKTYELINIDIEGTVYKMNTKTKEFFLGNDNKFIGKLIRNKLIIGDKTYTFKKVSEEEVKENREKYTRMGNDVFRII